MKILIISQYFWPEEFLINDFALGLKRRGYHVEVLTGLPNYPGGAFFPGYGLRGPYFEEHEGIPVWRSPLVPRRGGSGVRLAMNYASFAFAGCLRALQACRRSFDLILVYQLSPITMAIPAWLLRGPSRSKVFLWIQDLWPESMAAAGEIRSKTVFRLVNELTKRIYKGCDRIFIQSRAFRDSVLERGVEDKKVFYLPNFAEEVFQPVSVGAEQPEAALMPQGFRVMFAGNIGVSQDFETILSAAEQTRNRQDIQWVVLGDGRRKPWLAQEVSRRNLKNVHLIGRFHKDRMPFFFSMADAMLVSLKKEPLFALTVPSKIQAYLACAKPVIAALDGEGARIIEEAEAGISVPAEDPTALAAAVVKLSQCGPSELKEMGVKGRRYYDTHFSRGHVLDEFERVLFETIGTSPSK
jgi:colanic acid biosynthesis glycosyl transferase WcaI